MGDAQTLQDLDASVVASALGGNAAAIAAIKQRGYRILKWRKAAADAMASTATAAELIDTIPFAGVVEAVWAMADATITGDVANAFTATIAQADAAGGTPLTVGTLSSLTAQHGTFTKWVRKTGTLTKANLVVAAGGSLNIAIAKPGTGVVVSANFTVYVLVRDT